MGNKLFEELIELTGLPKETIREELHVILEKQGIDPDTLTLPQLRQALAIYLRDIFSKLQSE